MLKLGFLNKKLLFFYGKKLEKKRDEWGLRFYGVGVLHKTILDNNERYHSSLVIIKAHFGA